MIVGTAGHIDHGKTSLIKRLTGRDTDRLPEEIKRGISIELGYAYVPVGDDVLGFVDVPGHERFIHTMLAGATGVDFALLVIAADDGVMPQTDEHLDILLLLGISAGAVAVTKIDAVSAERVDEVLLQIADRVCATAAESWPVFPVSSLSGEGVDVLLAHLLAHSIEDETSRAARTTAGNFRMAIDRCFTLSGIGTVVTGTVHAGEIRVGESVGVGPTAHGALTARVRSVHAQDRASTVGVAGQRCALNLAGIERAQVERGMWVQAASLANIAERFDATLTLSRRVAKSLGNSSTVHWHHGTADAMAKVAVLDATRIEPAESQLVSLTLDRPLAVCRGDRFVIRDASAQRTLGGGTVLDVMPLGSAARRGRRAPVRLQLLAALRDGSPVDALRAWLDREPAALARITSGWNLRDSELAELIDASGAHVASSVAISAEHWQRLRSEVVTAIGVAHQKEPDMPGVEQQRLRRMIAPALDMDVFGSLIDELLEQSALQRRGAFLALPTHTAALGKDQRARWERIKPLLDDRKFDPPRVRDIARDTGIPEVEVRHL
ncbi:MAG: selenocysteine-specific translation elongation factor, partial [Pseudomonadota bacterium]|nr:selenocysteine-specific translation elongation factor [Pseudomonadota bacterium]